MAFTEAQLASVAQIREKIRCSVGLYLYSKRAEPIETVTLSDGKLATRQFVIFVPTVELTLQGIFASSNTTGLGLKIPLVGIEIGPSIKGGTGLSMSDKIKLTSTVDENFTEEDLKKTCGVETLDAKNDPYAKILLGFEEEVFKNFKKPQDLIEKNSIDSNPNGSKSEKQGTKQQVNKPYFIAMKLELTSSFTVEDDGKKGIKFSFLIFELGKEVKVSRDFIQEVKFSFILADPTDKIDDTVTFNPWQDYLRFQEIFKQNPGWVIAVMPPDGSEDPPCC